MNEIISMLTSAVSALAFGLVGIVALGWLIAAQTHLRKRMIVMVFPIIIMSIAIGSILTQRNFTAEAADTFSAIAANSGLISWFFRLTTALTLGICLARLVSVSQSFEHRSREGRALFFAFLLFYTSNLVLNNVFGTNPVFYGRFLPALVVFAAMYFSRQQGHIRAVDATKWGLLFLIIGSYVLVLVRPDIALQTDYDMSVLPGMHVRLWGLASNPNSLGPLSIVFLLLLTYKPFHPRWLQRLAVTAGIGVLVLTQSKTAWVAAVIAFFIVWWTRTISSPSVAQSRRISYYSPRNFAVPIVICLAALALVLIVAALSAFDYEAAAIDRKFQISSLTGRTDIWAAAIDAWKTNPLFGYGSMAWGPEFRQNIGIDAALSAHSQYFQSLSEAGAVGLFGLIVYMTLLFARSYIINRETRGLSLALFSIIFIRSISETPLDLTNIFSGDFLVHLLLFRLVLVKSRVPVSLPYAQVQPQFQWTKA